MAVGDLVYYRIFNYPPSANYLKSLLPKHNLAKIKEILGATSLLLTDMRSGRDISRHLIDVYPCRIGGNFENLFQNSKSAQLEENLEIEIGLEEPKITAKEVQIEKQECFEQGQKSPKLAESEVPPLEKRELRPRKPVKYKN